MKIAASQGVSVKEVGAKVCHLNLSFVENVIGREYIGIPGPERRICQQGVRKRIRCPIRSFHPGRCGKLIPGVECFFAIHCLNSAFIKGKTGCIGLQLLLYIALEENFGRFVGVAEADNFRTIKEIPNHPLGRIVVGRRHEVIKVRPFNDLSVLDPGKQMRPLVVYISGDPGIIY